MTTANIETRFAAKRRRHLRRSVALGLLAAMVLGTGARGDEPIVFLDGHEQSVTAVDWTGAIDKSSTGTLVTGSLDGTVRLWDITRRTSETLASDPSEAVSSLTLSADGHLVASGWLDGKILINDVPRRQPTDRWPIETGATTLALAANSATLAVGYETGNVSLYDATTGAQTATFAAGGGPVHRLIFEADAAALVVVTADGRIERRSVAGERLGTIQLDAVPTDVSLTAAGDSLAAARSSGYLSLYRWPPPAERSFALGAPAERIAMSAAGDWFAVTGDGGNVRIVNSGESQPARTVTSPAKVLTAVVTPDGASLIVGDDNGVLRQCPRGEGEFVPLVDTLQGAVHDVAWCTMPNSDQPLLATAGGDGSVRLWHYPPPPISETAVADAGVTQMATSPDRSRFAFADAAGKVRVVNADGSDVATIDVAQPIAGASFSADGTRLVTGAPDGRVRIQTLASGGALALEGLGAAVTAVAVSSDDARIAAADANGTLVVWNPADGAIVRRAALPSAATYLAFRPGSHQLVAITPAELRLWNDGADAPEALATFPAAARAAVLSGDGAHLAVASEDDTVRLYTPQDGLLVGVMDASGKPTRVALSASGRRLAAATDAELTVWDVASRRVLERRTLPAAATELAWADDERIVAACADGKMRTVPLTAVAILAGHDGPVRALATGDDKSLLVSGGDDATVRQWNLSDTTSQRVFDGAQDAVLDIAVSPDGRRLAAAGSDRYTRAWDTDSAQMICAVATPAVTRAVRFADADTLLAAGDDRVVRRLNVTTGNEAERDTEHTTAVRDLAPGADGAVISVELDGTVRQWTPSVTATARVADAALTAVCFTRDGQQLAVAAADGTISLYGAAGLATVRTFGEPTTSVHTLRTAGADGSTLVAATDRDLRGWNIADGTRVGGATPDGGVTTFAVDGDVARCVVAGWDAHLRYVSLSDGDTRFTTDLQPVATRAIVLAPDGASCYTITANGELCRWQVSPTEPRQRIAAHDGAVYALAISADGTTLASGGVDKAVKTWNVADGKAKATLAGHEAAVYGVALHNSEPRLASAGIDKAVRWWDLGSGKPAWEVKEGLPAPLYSVALGSDAARLFVGDAAGKLHWLATADGAIRGSTDAHHAPIYSVRLNPTGTRLATLGHNGELAAWNTETLEPLHREQLPVDKAFALAYSPDGSRLAVATVDRRLLIVTLPEAAR